MVLVPAEFDSGQPSIVLQNWSQARLIAVQPGPRPLISTLILSTVYVLEACLISGFCHTHPGPSPPSIDDLEDFLASPQRVLALVDSEAKAIAAKHGTDRKSSIISEEVS